MTINEYQQLAMTTLNKDLTNDQVLLNGVMGLCGESGEVIDIVKKHISQGHSLNKEKLIEELGDVAWYLAETSYALGVDLETVLSGNIKKLKERYPEDVIVITGSLTPNVSILLTIALYVSVTSSESILSPSTNGSTLYRISNPPCKSIP